MVNLIIFVDNVNIKAEKEAVYDAKIVTSVQKKIMRVGHRAIYRSRPSSKVDESSAPLFILSF